MKLLSSIIIIILSGHFSSMASVRFGVEGSVPDFVRVVSSTGIPTLTDGEPSSVDFVHTSLCPGQPIVFSPVISLQNNDSVVSMTWNIPGKGNSYESEPSVVFTKPGSWIVSLNVQTSSGETLSAAHEITISSAPTINFSSTPVAMMPGNTVRFEPEVSGQNLLFEWSFGENHYSSLPNPTFTFAHEGQTPVTLHVHTTQGCSYSITKNIDVVAPSLDLAIEQMHIDDNEPGNKKVNLRILNRGNFAVTEMNIEWQAGSETILSENWKGYLAAGAALDYEMVKSDPFSQVSVDQMCASVQAADLPFDDNTEEDNVSCKTFTDHSLEVYPPFPNPGDDHLFLRFTNSIPGTVLIKIINESGIIMQEFVDANVGTGFHQYFLNISQLGAGVYSIVINLGNQRRAVKFVRQME